MLSPELKGQKDKRTIGNNASGNKIVSTNINGNLTTKISKKNNKSCDSLRASIQDQTNEKQSSKILVTMDSTVLRGKMTLQSKQRK